MDEEQEYWDIIAELEDEVERDNLRIIKNGGNLDDPPKYFND